MLWLQVRVLHGSPLVEDWYPLIFICGGKNLLNMQVFYINN